MDDVAVSPIVAVILLLAITVVLAGVMYATFSSMILPQQNPVYIGCDVHQSYLLGGYYWWVDVVSVEPRIQSNAVSLTILYPNSSIALPSTKLPLVPEFHDTEPNGTLNPGDYFLLSEVMYPAGSTFMLVNDYQIISSRQLGV
jgi:flagellin-like protein